MPEKQETESRIRGTMGGFSFTEADIVANSLSVTMSTCEKGSFAFGTFNAAVLKMSLRYTGETPDGAVIALTKDETSLGRYRVDDSKTKRRGNILSVTAVDAATLFDVELPAEMKQQTYTASTAISAACQAVSVPFGGIAAGMPNQNVTFIPSSASVQTYRDLVMWCAMLLCGNAVIDRFGVLQIRPAGYVAGQSSTYTSTAENRSDIQFSDTRTWVKYMTAYSGSKIKTYVGGDMSDSQARPGSITLPRIPLLDGKTEAECDVINSAVRGAGIAALVRDITAKCVDDPSVSLGDMATFSGGKVDIRGSILGVVTGITWRFRGVTTVTCTAPTSVKEG
jgi:hypothetical protein